MFEIERLKVQAGVEFLKCLLAKDYSKDPTFDREDLKAKIAEIQADADFLHSNLPHEAIDDDEELELQYPEEFADNEELEDEVVECDKVIEECRGLIKEVKERYLRETYVEPHYEIPRSKEEKKDSISLTNILLIVIAIALISLILIFASK